MASEVKASANSAVKAGMWYTVCNFIFRGMAFITTPIFARLMSKTELGDFSNFATWASVLMVVTSFDMAQSIIRSKLEVEDDIHSYIWSILALSTLSTTFFYGVVCIFSDFFTNLFEMNMQCIHLMFLYLLVTPAYSMLITKHRAFYKYKTFVAFTGISLVSATLTSLLLVVLMENKFAGRLLGNYIPHIVMNLAIFIYLMVKGKKIKIKYWKYALVICLPLVPHNLSLYLLSSSDKILITKMCGSQYTAVYSIAYSCYHIITILFDSMNKAWAPWLLDSLHKENYGAIKKNSKVYIGVFMALIVGVLMLVPEIIFIFGGSKYRAAVYCLPPLAASCSFQFVYTMYVNIEFYKKKTLGVAGATIIASLVNIGLNFIFIPMNPEKSFVIAAYTTLAGYILLFILHYFIVRRMKMSFVYDIGFILKMLAGILIVSGIMNLLYMNTIIRYIVVLIYGSITLYFIYRYRDVIKGILFKKKRKKS